MERAPRDRTGRTHRIQAKRIPPYDWKIHKPDILRLYLDQKQTADEVVKKLNAEHDFIVT